jgi:hypothetical protein
MRRFSRFAARALSSSRFQERDVLFHLEYERGGLTSWSRFSLWRVIVRQTYTRPSESFSACMIPLRTRIRTVSTLVPRISAASPGW